jgi:hypothetical protein
VIIEGVIIPPGFCGLLKSKASQRQRRKTERERYYSDQKRDILCLERERHRD